MLRSSNDLTSQQNFTIRVRKQPDGSFHATTPNYPKLPAIKASSEQLAAAQLGDQLHKLHAEGKL